MASGVGNEVVGVVRPNSMRLHARLVSFLVVGVTVTVMGGRLRAGQTRTVQDGVYNEGQAGRGQGLYKARCAACHGASLLGGLAPPLSGEDFVSRWTAQPLAELAGKIRNTMPANAAGTLTPQEAADLTAYMLQVGKFPAGRSELPTDEAALRQIAWPARSRPAAPSATTSAPLAGFSPPLGNLAQVMRGILFPSSNLIFNVQSWDPGTLKPPPPGSGAGNAGFSWVDWGAGIYKGWELVDYAAVALAESAPLMLTPGRRCENGKPVPVERPDWIKFSVELAEAGRAAYKASQSRNQDQVSEVTEQVSNACLHCHEIYRDKPGGTPADPSNKAARCVP